MKRNSRRGFWNKQLAILLSCSMIIQLLMPWQTTVAETEDSLHSLERFERFNVNEPLEKVSEEVEIPVHWIESGDTRQITEWSHVEIVVRFIPNLSDQEAVDLLSSFHPQYIRKLSEEWLLTSFKDADKAEEAYAFLQQNEKVLHVEFNHSLSANGSNDLSDGDTNWALEAIEAEDAWISIAQHLLQSQSVTESVYVAIVDSGIDSTHMDLQGRVIPGINVIPEASDPLDTMDENGHGTHIAGIIASNGINDRKATGVTGSLPIYLLPIKALDRHLEASLSTIYEAIKEAVDWRGPHDERVRIINLSFGERFDQPPQLLVDAINYAIEREVLIIAAAGNDGWLTDGYYPASLPEVISVGGSGQNHQLMASSNRNADIVAPGEAIYSTLPDNSYGVTSGTSYAAAFATGVAAMLMSAEPGIDRGEVQVALLDGQTVRSCPTLEEELALACKVLSAAKVLANRGIEDGEQSVIEEDTNMEMTSVQLFEPMVEEEGISDWLVRTVKASVENDGTEYPWTQSISKPMLSSGGQHLVYRLSSAVMWHDLQTGRTERVSISWDGRSGSGDDPAISAEGRYVAFSSSSGLVSDSNNRRQIYVRDMISGVLERITNTEPDEAGRVRPIFAHHNKPIISADGNLVVYQQPSFGLHIYNRETGERKEIELNHGTSIVEAFLSADGRYLFFESQNFGLPTGESYAFRSIIKYDLQEDSWQRISKAYDGGELNDAVWLREVSANGEWVLFDSFATNILDDEVTDRHVYIYNWISETTLRVSVNNEGAAANNTSLAGGISADGRFVFYRSNSSNLSTEVNLSAVNGFAHQKYLPYVYDVVRSEVHFFGYNNNGEQFNEGINWLNMSADGKSLAFMPMRDTETNFVSHDLNGNADIFVSFIGPVGEIPIDSPGWVGNSLEASNEGPAQMNLSWSAADRDVKYYHIYADGQRVGGSNGQQTLGLAAGLSPLTTYDIQVIAEDRFGNRSAPITASFTTVEKMDSPANFQAERYDRGLILRWEDPLNGRVASWKLYRDGEEIHTQSSGNRYFYVDKDLEPATTYIYTMEVYDDFHYNGNEGHIGEWPITTLAAGEGVTTTQVTRKEGVDITDTWGSNPAMNADGQVIAFASTSAAFVDGIDEGNNIQHIYVRDGETIELISVATDGNLGDATSSNPSLSSDGNFVAFESLSSTFYQRENGGNQVFLRDRQSQQTELVSRGINGSDANNWSGNAVVSGDGRYVAFESRATNLTLDDPGPGFGIDIFLYDRIEQTIQWVSRPFGDAVPNWADSSRPAISHDGRYVVFQSRQQQLVPGGTSNDTHIFIWDRVTAETRQVSITATGIELTEQLSDANNNSPTISADGRYVIFQTETSRVFSHSGHSLQRWDRDTGELKTVSYRAHGGDGLNVAFGPRHPKISPDGRYVLFGSHDQDVTPQPVDSGTETQLYVRDMETGRVYLVSVSSQGEPNASFSIHEGSWAINQDGTHMVYQSGAHNLTEDRDSGLIQNVFLTVLEYAVEPPSWPANSHLSASHVGAMLVQLQWSAAEVASGEIAAYYVYLDNDVIATLDGTELGYTVQGLTPNTSYTFRIEAENLAGKTTNGPTLQVQTKDFSDGAALLVAESLPGGQVRLQWEEGDPVEGINGYVIQRRKAGEDNWQEIVQIDGINTQSYLDTNLPAETELEYQVLQRVSSDNLQLVHTLPVSVITDALKIEEWGWGINSLGSNTHLALLGGNLIIEVLGTPHQNVEAVLYYKELQGDEISDAVLEKKLQLTENEVIPGVYQGEIAIEEGMAELTSLKFKLENEHDQAIEEVDERFPIYVSSRLTINYIYDLEPGESPPRNLRVIIWNENRRTGAWVDLDEVNSIERQNMYHGEYLILLEQEGVEVDRFLIELLPGQRKSAERTPAIIGSVDIQVLNPDGTPLENERVTIVEKETYRLIGMARTNVEGIANPFGNQRLVQGTELIITVESDNPYLKEQIQVEAVVPKGHEQLAITSPWKGSWESRSIVTGVVQSEDGSPIAHADLFFIHPEFPSKSFEATTDISGSYEIELPSGESELRVSYQLDGDKLTTTKQVIIPANDEYFLEVVIDTPYIYTIELDFQIKFPGEDWRLENLENWRTRVSYHVDVTVGQNRFRASHAYPYQTAGHKGEKVRACVKGHEANLPNACEEVVLGDQTHLVIPLRLEQTGTRVLGQIAEEADGNWRIGLSELNEENQRVRTVTSTTVSGTSIDLFAPEEGTYLLQLTGQKDGQSMFYEHILQVDDQSTIDLGLIEVFPAGHYTGRIGNDAWILDPEPSLGSVVTVRVLYRNGAGSATQNSQLLLDAPSQAEILPHSVVLNGVPQPDAGRVLDLGTIAPEAEGVVLYQVRLPREFDINEEKIHMISRMVYDGGEEIIGVTDVFLQPVTLDAPERIASLNTSVSGRAPLDSQVDVYVDDAWVGRTQATPGGYWSMEISLPEINEVQFYKLHAVAKLQEDHFVSESQFVLYQKNQPRLLEVTMSQGFDGHRVTFQTDGAIPIFPYVYVPRRDIRFDLTFHDPGRVDQVRVRIEGMEEQEAVWDEETETYVAFLSGSQSLGKIYVSYEVEEGVPFWTASTSYGASSEVLEWPEEWLEEEGVQGASALNSRMNLEVQQSFQNNLYGEINGTYRIQLSTGYEHTGGETVSVPSTLQPGSSHQITGVSASASITRNRFSISVSGYLPEEMFIERDQVAPYWAEQSQLFVTEAQQGTELELAWTPALDDVWIRAYEIYQNGVRIAMVPGDRHHYVATGLTPGEEVHFSVRAIDVAQRSSAEVLETTVVVGLMGTAATDEMVASFNQHAEALLNEHDYIVRGAGAKIRTAIFITGTATDGVSLADLVLGMGNFPEIQEMKDLLDQLDKCSMPDENRAFMEELIDRAINRLVADAIASGVLMGAAVAAGVSGVGIVGGAALAVTSTAVGAITNRRAQHSYQQAKNHFEFLNSLGSVECEEDEDDNRDDNRDDNQDNNSFEERKRPVANPRWIYDPSGYVYAAVEHNRIEGVRATIFTGRIQESLGAFGMPNGMVS